MRRRKQRKIFLWILLGVSVFAFVLGGVKLYRVNEARKSGILLAFDDYSEENWTDHLEFFDKYQVPVTFFCNIGATDGFLL